MNVLTQDRLKEVLDYDQNSGLFTWAIDYSKKSSKGSVAGKNHSAGYRVVFFDASQHMMHRLAWLYIYGVLPEKHIDHINGNKVDNRISNLREVTHSENQQNRKRTSNTSGFSGVTKVKDKARWGARIRINYNKIFLGYFDSPELAYEAYLKAKRHLHPASTI